MAAPELGMELVEFAARSAVVDFFFLSSAAAPPRASLDPEASRELLVLPARVPSEPARWFESNLVYILQVISHQSKVLEHNKGMDTFWTLTSQKMSIMYPKHVQTL